MFFQGIPSDRHWTRRCRYAYANLRPPWPCRWQLSTALSLLLLSNDTRARLINKTKWAAIAPPVSQRHRAAHLHFALFTETICFFFMHHLHILGREPNNTQQRKSCTDQSSNYINYLVYLFYKCIVCILFKHLLEPLDCSKVLFMQVIDCIVFFPFQFPYKCWLQKRILVKSGFLISTLKYSDIINHF